MKTPTDLGSTLIFDGSAVKALGNGKVGGYLVLFGSPDETDISPARDYFTSETDFGLEDGAGKSSVLYHHALDVKMGGRRLGAGTLKQDEVGVWIEAQLALRDAYEKALYGAVEAGKMGWSSGTADHLVRREQHKNGSHRITMWPLGIDASITPTPAEPRTKVVSIKAILGEPTMKLMAEGDDDSGGATVPEEHGKGGKDSRFRPGDHVKWNERSGVKAGMGKVASVHRKGVVPDVVNDRDVEGSKEMPAARVKHDSGEHTAHPFKCLKPMRKPAMKGLYLGETETTTTLGALERLHMLACNCLYGCVADPSLDAAERLDRVDAILTEYHDAVMDVLEGLMGESEPDGDEYEGETAAKARSIASTFRERLYDGLSLDDHSDSVDAAVKGLTVRLDRTVEFRASEGRKLSANRIEAIKGLSDSMAALVASATKGTQANPLPAEFLQLQADLLRFEASELLA